MPCLSIAAWRFWRKQSWMDSTLKLIDGMVRVHADPKVLMVQLARHQLIRNYMFCTRCPGMKRMHLYASKSITERYFWRCRHCHLFSSVRKGSFFQKTKITLPICLWLIKHWANRLTARASSNELGLSQNTVMNFRKHIRSACCSVSYPLAGNFSLCRKTGWLACG